VQTITLTGSSHEYTIARFWKRTVFIWASFQLSLEIRNGFARTADASAAVNQDRLFQALKRFPNFLELSIRKRGMLVVANWDVLDAESVLPVVRNQIHVKLCVESQLLFVKQVDNRCFCRL